MYSVVTRYSILCTAPPVRMQIDQPAVNGQAAHEFQLSPTCMDVVLMMTTVYSHVICHAMCVHTQYMVPGVCTWSMYLGLGRHNHIQNMSIRGNLYLHRYCSGERRRQ